MENNHNDSERLLIVDGKTTRLESAEEEKARIAATKAELEAQFKAGKISGAEYNRKLIALMVPEEYKLKPPKRRWIGIPVGLVIILAISVIPAMIYLNWRFYFQNDLSTTKVMDYDGPASSIESGPVQINIDGYTESGKYKGRPIRMTYKAYYDLTGVVVSVRDYWGFGAYDTLVPRDVCVIWGGLVDVYDKHEAEFSQGERNCKPRINGVDIDELNASKVRGGLGNILVALYDFSNNHIISSTAEVRNQIFSLGVNDKVRLIGYLVWVEFDGITLSSSLLRNDTGNGACEVFYVTKVEKI